MHKKKNLIIRGGLLLLAAPLLSMFSRGGAAVKNAFSVSKFNGATPPATILTGEPEYHVVNVKDLSPAGANMTAKTSVEAYQLQEQLLAKDPSLQGQVMVVAGHELN